MKDLLDQYPHARKMLEAGDFSGMIAFEGGLGRVPRGFDEGNMSWMGGKADLFMKKLDRSVGIAGNFWNAVQMSQVFRSDGYRDGSKDWHVCVPADMSIPSDGILLHYEEPVYELVGRPIHIPEYAADTGITCKTGEVVPWTGVWVPTTGMATAALAFARQGLQIMQPAYELAREFDEDEYLETTKLVDTGWHPVKPTGRMIPLPALESANGADSDASSVGGVGRCKAGQPCPSEGVWFTPAKLDSRRHFKHGEIMPLLGEDYGLTIWQWATDQEG